MSDDNYYEELGVDPGASRDEIRDAHRARIENLEAERERKGITESQLQQNREEVARVRKAWNVLSDPYQRGRYDQRISAPTSDEEVSDDDDVGAAGTEVELTGWRKLLAPPPPKNGTSNGGARDSAARGRNPATGRRERPEPTIVLPAGMQLAEPRNRGIAALFDIAVCLVIFTTVNLFVPGLIQSDYKSTQDKISKLTDVHSAQNDVSDAQSSVKSAKSASDRSSAQKDLASAQKDLTKAEKEAKKKGVKTIPPTAKATQTKIDNLGDHIQTTTWLSAFVALVLMLLFLVPVCARTGSTFGMRRRRIRVVRVDGSPVGWYASFTRFLIPLLFAVAIPTLGPLIGFGIVGYAYFDKNRQGVHDKLARTVIVDA
jgi:curved DNA-binding protein CbpA